MQSKELSAELRDRIALWHRSSEGYKRLCEYPSVAQPQP